VIGRASRFDRAHHGAHRLGEAKPQRNSARQGNRTGAYTEIGAADPSMGDKFSKHETRCVRGYRKADSLRSRNDCRVDANDVAMRRDKRAAGIAGIERGVGLDHRLTGHSSSTRSGPAPK
jgi:hypothetical protein